MSTPLIIRPYEAKDEEACYRICLETGDFGADGTHLFEDPKLLGHIYVGSYLKYAPDLAFVLEDEEGVCGYTLGVLDSAPFYARTEAEWFPPLRKQYSAPTTPREKWSTDEGLCNTIHNPPTPKLFDDYPSHLHIDIIKRGQGHGMGRTLMDTLIDALRAQGSTGVHFGVSLRNHNAQGFYKKYGFTDLDTDEYCLYMGMKL